MTVANQLSLLSQRVSLFLVYVSPVSEGIDYDGFLLLCWRNYAGSMGCMKGSLELVLAGWENWIFGLLGGTDFNYEYKLTL